MEANNNVKHISTKPVDPTKNAMDINCLERLYSAVEEIRVNKVNMARIILIYQDVNGDVVVRRAGVDKIIYNGLLEFAKGL